MVSDQVDDDISLAAIAFSNQHVEKSEIKKAFEAEDYQGYLSK
jgi:hypothetical protein